MNSIKTLLAQDEIQFFLFDMDRTLVDTREYFDEEMTNAIIDIVSHITKDLPLKEQLSITKEIIEIGNQIYQREKSPMLIDTFSLEAINTYCEQNSIKINRKEILKKLRSLYKDFYLTSPRIFPYTIKILNKVSKLGVKMGVYSHAQYDWTGIKIENIKKEYFEKYHKELKLSFFTTDINDSKDKQGWINAGKYFNFDFKKTLVIGDSLTSDIYPAIDAGYKYLVYLSHTNKKMKITDTGKSTLFVKKNISKLFT